MDQQDLVLLGGGHTHVLLIKALAMNPIAGVRVTLISEKTLTPYSGMLPGFVAGHYSLKQTNIDLNQLCRRAGVRWIKATASMLDPDRKRVFLADQAHLDFDTLSIDIGSTPDQRIKGATEYAIGVKPIAGFQRRWTSLLTSSAVNQDDSTSIQSGDWGVIGAGAGGVELVLAMAHRMRHHKDLRFHLVYRGEHVLPGYPQRVIAMAERYLQGAGVILHAKFRVSEVTAEGVLCDTGRHLDLEQSILCTGAVGAPWLADSGLHCSAKNFIQVNHYLQSTSHDCVFAVGDIAESVTDPRPKAGVFAVRQAPHLERNLRLMFAGKAMRNSKLQKQFLSLLSMGDREAIASRNGLAVKGSWVWRWKDLIDRKFMRQFSELKMSMAMPAVSRDTAVQDTELVHCGGCGSKLGPAVLMDNLNHLANLSSSDNGNPAPVVAEDANLWEPTPGTLTVQSIDGFRSFTSDEYRFARICVNHAASDILAMGARLTHAQAWINLAFSDPLLHQRDHLRILQGIADGLVDQGAGLSGGHSTEGAESHLAIVANGELKAGKEWSKSGIQAGDVLLLSKGLGTGVILAADMQGEAIADSVDAAYQSMLLSNHASMQQLQAHNPHAVTDVTGFGLLGHLLEMLDGAMVNSGNSLQAELDLTAIQTIPGALELAVAGWRSSLYPQLESYLQRCSFDPCSVPQPGVKAACQSDDVQESAKIELLLDPQTSGGLLASLAAADANALLQADSNFVAIGRIRQEPEEIANLADIRFISPTKGN